MVYLDTPFLVTKEVYPNAPRCFLGKHSAHLTADTEDELTVYARSIGMRPQWRQKYGTKYFHFDATGQFLTKALADDRVKKVDSRGFVRIIHSRSNLRCKLR